MTELFPGFHPERLVLFIMLLVVSMAIQAFFYVRGLQKAGRSGWWTATIYLSWLLGIVFIVVGGASWMMLVSGAVLMAVVPVAAIWVFAFVRWPLISTTEPTPTWKQLVATRDSSTNRWFEMAATELESTNIDRATWARALALAEGGEPAARAKYIQFRVVDLAELERSRHAEKVEDGNMVARMASEASSKALGLTAMSLVLLFSLWGLSPWKLSTESRSWKPSTQSPIWEEFDKMEEAKVEAAHPGWERLIKSPKFEAWLQAQNEEVKKLADSPHAADAIRLLDLYKAGQP